MASNEPSQFTELSFAFAFAHHLANLWQDTLLAAPTTPTQVAEGQPGGGWDQRFDCEGFVYLVQYKVSEYCIHGRTRGASALGSPFYRFQVRTGPKVNQHSQLIELAAGPSIVEYVAPCFHTSAELHQHYAAASILEAVRRMRPADVGDLEDGSRHFIAFTANGSAPHLCSEPVALPDGNYPVYAPTGFAPTQAAGPDATTTPRTSLGEQVRAVLDAIGEFAQEGGLLAAAGVENLPPSDQLVLLAKLVLGADAFLVRSG